MSVFNQKMIMEGEDQANEFDEATCSQKMFFSQIFFVIHIFICSDNADFRGGDHGSPFYLV